MLFSHLAVGDNEGTLVQSVRNRQTRDGFKMHIKGQDHCGNLQGTCRDVQDLKRKYNSFAVQFPAEFESPFPNRGSAGNPMHCLPSFRVALQHFRRAPTPTDLTHYDATSGDVPAIRYSCQFKQRVYFLPEKMNVPRAVCQYRPAHDGVAGYVQGGSATRNLIGSLAGSNMSANSSGGTPLPRRKIAVKRSRRSISFSAYVIASVFVFEPVDSTTRSNKSPSIFNVSLIHHLYISNTYNSSLKIT